MSQSVNEPEKKMKLFVAGPAFADPDTWDGWTPVTLVMAESEQQALGMVDELRVMEVRMDKPAVLAKCGW